MNILICLFSFETMLASQNASHTNQCFRGSPSLSYIRQFIWVVKAILRILILLHGILFGMFLHGINDDNDDDLLDEDWVTI